MATEAGDGGGRGAHKARGRQDHRAAALLEKAALKAGQADLPQP